MTDIKIDELISRFKEFKEELNKVHKPDVEHNVSGVFHPETKPKKFQGGDPRHSSPSDHRRASKPGEGPRPAFTVSASGTKITGVTSGRSELRNKIKKDEDNEHCSSCDEPLENCKCEGGPHPVDKAEAGPNPKVMSVKKPLKPSDVKDGGPFGFAIAVPKDNKGATSERHPIKKKEKLDQEDGVNVEDTSLRQKNVKMKILPAVGKAEGKVKIHTHKNGQWDLKNEGAKDHASQFNDNKGKSASGPI